MNFGVLRTEKFEKYRDINYGFEFVTIENAPKDFVSFPISGTNEVVGYLIDTGELEDLPSFGKGTVSENTVFFDLDDVLVYDKNGNVFYAKGYPHDGRYYYNATSYTNTQKVYVDYKNALLYVNSLAKKTGTEYGDLYSTSLYTGSVYNPGTKIGQGVYTDNGGLLQYNEEGALVLDTDNAIPVLELNGKYKFNDAYTVSITVDGDISQGRSVDKNPVTILAISGTTENYYAWLGYYNNYLYVYTFYKGKPKSITTSSATGYCRIDMQKYKDQIVNIQVSAVKNQQTEVYLNGEKVASFKSGNSSLVNKYLTIGDLRVGRNLKFTGFVYDFAIFDKALTEEQVKVFYEKSKAYGGD
ncbi:MAG: hypothetical protein IJ220_00970 [Clostridia bacterium]|nr:hypothetical protein [Clostridia bacterium]